MQFPYRRVLVVGATSGIGESLAARIVKEGSKVIVVGRREENLKAFVDEHGTDKAAAELFDISNTDQIPSFAARIAKEYPDLDCVFMNSGIQRGLDYSSPESVDLDEVQTEFKLNYFSFLALTKAFLPFLMGREGDSGLIFTTSQLAMVPMLRCPNYCASKAALHQFILCLREQLRSSNVNVIELFPPAVQTELHDEKHQPDIKNGRSIGIPLSQFTKEAYEGLAAGHEQVAVGLAKETFDKVEPERQKIFQQQIKAG